jgi:hypothetical protein
MKFCPTPRPLQPVELTAAVPNFVRAIRLRCQFGDTPGTYNRKIYVPNKSFQPKPAPAAVEAILEAARKDLATFSWTPSKRKNLNPVQRHILQMLRQRPDLKIVMTDKNLGPALFTHEHYLRLCLDHLQDPQVYRRTTMPPVAVTNLVRATVRRWYNSMAKRHAYDPDWKDTAIVVRDIADRRLNVFYALAKIHKPRLSIRPIVSNSGSILEGLSKWLDYQLQPYFKDLPSYLSNSDQLLDDLPRLSVNSATLFLTADVESLYTNIPIERAVDIIANRISGNRWSDAILSGLQVVMKSNYFSFGDTHWLQLSGTAMGTPVAPAFASLYVAHFEELLLEEFRERIVYYKRYIDDILLIWQPGDFAYEHKRFLAKFTQKSRLRLTHTESTDKAAFLDLWILKNGSTVYTRTHQKALNLYLYVPANSAHPPGILKGLILGLIRKYHAQNPRPRDFKRIVKSLFTRLQARGYTASALEPVFRHALETVTTPASRPRPKPPPPIVFKLQYDPNGPDRATIRRLIHAQELEHQLGTPVRICYTKPPTFKNLLCPSALPTRDPSPAALLDCTGDGS